MTTTELVPFLKGFLEGKESLDKYQVEFLKKTLGQTVEPYQPITIPSNPWPTVTIPPNPILPPIWYSANGGTATT